MNNSKFTLLVIEKIANEYEVFESNVDSPDRSIDTYINIQKRIIREMKELYPGNEIDREVFNRFGYYYSN